MSRPRWMIPAWIYVYRTRKPGAWLGLPIVGRHFGYAGQTRNPDMRHIEHTQGGGRYGKQAACWSDLDPKRYAVCLGPCPQWLLNLIEILVIRLLMPAYNIQHNRGNPRRIKPWVAQQQRAQRDQRGWSWNFRLVHLVLVVAVVAFMVWRGLQS